MQNNGFSRSQYNKALETMNKLIEMQPAGLTSFEFYRGQDESGVSGTGKVLEGIVYSDGSVAIHWCVDLWSMTFFQDWQTFVKIHIGSHPGNQTVMVFHPSSREMPDWTWKQ